NAECVNTLKKIELIDGHDFDTGIARVSNKFRFNRRVDSVEGPTLSGEHAGRECGTANAFHAEWRAIDEAVSAVAGLLDRCRDAHGNSRKDSGKGLFKPFAFRAFDIKQMECLGPELGQGKGDRRHRRCLPLPQRQAMQFRSFSDKRG
ncbi:MAG: hypothetical protein WAV38_13580, partial [Xanthobacteraceae bacterium]